MLEDKCILFTKKFGYLKLIHLCAGRELVKRASTDPALPYFYSLAPCAPPQNYQNYFILTKTRAELPSRDSDNQLIQLKPLY